MSVDQPELDIEDIYELSPMQIGMLFQSLLAPESAVFVEQQAMRLTGPIDAEAFERAWQAVIDRTPVLRASFHWGDMEKPAQVIHRRVPLKVERLDWRDLATAPTARLADYLRQMRQAPFDFAVPPLMRVALARTADGATWFIWQFHHILLDGWSGQLLLRELVDQYRAIVSGQPYSAPQRAPFSAYIGWLQGQNPQLAEGFWRQELRGFTAPTAIGVGRAARPGVAAGNEGEHVFTVSTTDSEALREFAKAHRLTLNTLLQGAWALLLSRYSGDADVMFGSVVSGRPAEVPGVETMVGLFINTLPVRVAVNGDEQLLEWLVGIQRRQLEASQYQHVSALQLQQWSELPKAVRLFDTVLILENFPTAVARGAALDNEPIYLGRTDVELTVIVVPGDALRVKLLYDQRRFDTETIARIGANFVTLLRQLPASAQKPLCELSPLSAEEYRRTVVDWNATATPGYEAVSLMEHLQSQASKNPDAVAFVENGLRVTVREIDERSNQLARYLMELGVRAGTVVGVCCDRSIATVVAALAVLKARAVYLPLDPAYPPERRLLMIEDARASFVLARAAKLGAGSARVLDIDAVCGAAQNYPSAGGFPHAAPGDLAYIIYTSGSTGRPKGVAVEHGAILNRLEWMWRRYPFAAGEVGVMRTPLNFVDSLWEMLGPLLRGVPTIIANETVARDPQAFVALLAAHGVTRLWFVPSFLEMLLEACPDIGKRAPTLKFWSSGGEPLTASLYSRFRRAVPAATIYNVYGASEFWDATVFDPSSDGALSEVVPIGRPIDNTEAYVLDRFRQPVPIGVTGELHIGGACLARGYVGDDQLTRSRFIPHPFSDRPGARLFATGDLARHRSDGSIEYVARRDLQIKLRGFRIEPGEIEAVIDTHPSVLESLVVARELSPGDARLVAYVVPTNGTGDSSAVLAHVRTRLPSFMVPAAAVWLDALPMTPSGKRDREGLPAVSGAALAAAIGVTKGRDPETPLERLVAAQFASVLGVPSVRADDDFFADLGGHSLLATRLVSRLRDVLGIDLPLRTVFDAPTVAQMAAAMALLDTAGAAPGDAKINVAAAGPTNVDGEERRDYPPSFAQERLWFLDQLSPGNPFYNVGMAQRVSFAFNPTILERALTELVRRHESLRTVFPEVGGEPMQRILPAQPVRCRFVDLRDQAPAGRDLEVQRIVAEDFQTAFDLATAPLFRTTVVQLGPADSVFVFVVHHIIADSWSMDIVFRELSSLYADAAAGRQFSLAEPAIQYASFATWQRDWLRGEVLERQLSYWTRQLDGLSTVNLPTDRPRPPVQTYRGASLDVHIPAGLARALHALGREAGATPFMTMLAGFFALLQRYTAQDDLVVGVPVANRTRGDVEGVIGFFANSLVLRGDLSGSPSFRTLLTRVRETALDAYSHQDLPFSTLVAALRPPHDLSRNPLFQVSFQLISRMQAKGTGTNRAVAFERGTAIFDIVLNLWESDDGELSGLLEYNTDLFDRSTIERMLRHYRKLLEAAAATPDLAVERLPILSDEERHRLLVEWNATAADYPLDSCLHTLVERQTARTPDAIAVRDGATFVSYAALDVRATEIALRLQSIGVGPRRCVGVKLAPSIDMVAAVLGILKSGNAYVPLDTSVPDERLTAMLDDASVECVVTSAAAGELPSRRVRTIAVDAELPTPVIRPWVAPEVMADDLAYIMFTSGSTGRPKGVMVPHRNVVNYLTWCQGHYPVGDGVGAPLCSPIASDMSVTSLFLPLVSGGSVVLLDSGDVIESLDAALRDGPRFSFVKVTPSHLEALRNLAVGRGAPGNTAALVVGGEALSGATLELWRERSPEMMIYNEYGPTETVVGCAVHATRAGDVAGTAVPIGRPIANTSLYVLDRHGAPTPIGVAGELFIAGAGVASGYVGAPELTAERFVPNPFSGRPDQRMYRTGDLVRYRADGTLEYLGRMDRQLKIRGYRVEPGDIEAALRRHPAVGDAAVIARDGVDGDRRLVAYIAPANSPHATPHPSTVTPLSADELRRFLVTQLPQHMIPSAFETVDALPLTPSGKTDLRALEQRGGTDQPRSRPWSAPTTALSRVIADVFCEVLKGGPVGAHDHFFAELGGHSLLATKAVARLRERLRVDLPLRRVFEAPTAEGLAQVLRADPQIGARVERAAEAIVAVQQMSDSQVREQLSADLPAGVIKPDEKGSANGLPGER